MSEGNYRDILLQPFFIQGKKGQLFCLFTPPQSKHNNVLLFLPSFAEELNRCRVMVAMQARKLAAQGQGFLLLDYYGTGDSEGDFADTTWEQWRDDAWSAYYWLTEQGYNNISLWGVRVGSLLAAEMANQESQCFKQLLLWQPVLDGQAFLTQFLRLRLAMLMDRGEPKETTQQMRQHLQPGKTLEVAGYTITSQLAQSLDEKKLLNYQNIKMSVNWFEAVMDNDSDLSLGSQNVIKNWSEHGTTVNTHTYQGPAFWQLHERELTPDLLNKTTALFI